MAVVDPTSPGGPPVSGQNSRLILVSGPARSGKSRWAEHLLDQHPVVTYIATAASRPDDPDWQKRLEAHQKRRPNHWSVTESGAELVHDIDDLAPGESVLIDALGGFVAHHLDLSASEWDHLCERLIASIKSSHCSFVLVIEETGWGVVPPTRIGGLFRDRLGSLAQSLDRVADDAWLVLQGRALNLHALGTVVP